MLARLGPGDRDRMVGAMATLSGLMQGEAEEVVIRRHRPGDIGAIVAGQARVYTREYGWNDEFEALVAEIWGWQLPVAALKYWIRGIPRPGHPVADAEFAGAEVTRFRQSGWLVEPGAYRDVDGLALPTRLRLEAEGAILTLLINRWGPPAP